MGESKDPLAAYVGLIKQAQERGIDLSKVVNRRLLPVMESLLANQKNVGHAIWETAASGRPFAFAAFPARPLVPPQSARAGRGRLPGACSVRHGEGQGIAPPRPPGPPPCARGRRAYGPRTGAGQVRAGRRTPSAVHGGPYLQRTAALRAAPSYWLRVRHPARIVPGHAGPLAQGYYGRTSGRY